MSLNGADANVNENPPEVLDNLVDELIVFAKDHDEEMTAEWFPEDAVYVITSDDLEPVSAMVIDIDDAMYGESEAIVVEAEIGPLDKDADGMEFLRFADANLVYSRLAVSQIGDEEILVLQGACPVSQLSAAQFDAMVREIAVYSQELVQNTELEEG